MSFCRRLIPLALLVGATAAPVSCGDQSPVGVRTPALAAARALSVATATGKSRGLLACSQAYDSVTKVIGPQGDTLRVGQHILAINSLALRDTVRITAVAPADTVRWVRFHPDGLVFQPTADGWSALLFTNYTDCGVTTSGTLRVAQVTDSLAILGYLQTYVRLKKNPWSQANQFVVGLLQHFSNYAVAW
jgi:hypothetical protein